MEILLTIIHLLACFILVIVVLLQKGKGADLAGAFGGGGSQTALGVRSATQFIHKLTIAAAIFFMVTSYSLGLIQSSKHSIAADVEAVSGEAGVQTGDEAEESSEPNEDATEPGSESDTSSSEEGKDNEQDK